MRTRDRTTCLAILLAMLAMLAAATAAADGGRHEAAREKLRAKFDAADANHDGALTRAEAEQGMPHVARHFDDADTDRDGRLSIAEVAAYLARTRAARK